VSMDLNSASTVVLQVLTQATSQDTAVLKPAEEQLKQWETQPGFYSVLLIATQIAVLIAKVARLDCPRQWPELIPTLIESVKVQDDLRQHRALLTFYHVTKTLASKRLAADRKLFYDLLDFLDQHPFSFTPLIQRSLEFSVSYVFTEVGEGVTFERFIVQCMNLIKMIVKNYAYKPSKNFEAVEETGGDSWKYSLRPCTEVLFIDIFHEYNQTLTPVLLEMMQTLQGPTNVEDMNALLIKDAVYNAVGLAAYELFDSVDFDQWFKNQLLPELQVIHNRYKPLRRRVIWLIGQWISVKFKSDLRPMLYEAICNLLQDQDLVVSALHLLMILSLEQISFYRSESIRPYVGCLVQYLPLLWKQSEEHNMLRCAILTTLIHLVQGLGADSKNLYPFLLPVIQLSTDVSQPPHVYLLEDGLEL
ncbi:Importin-11, partial [Camelus dromedarius]